jgi:hypothetical protein
MTERMRKKHIEKPDAVADQQKTMEARAEKIRNEIKANILTPSPI